MQVIGEVGNKSGGSVFSARAALRGAGRVALWAVVALLLLRGFLSTVPGATEASPVRVAAGAGQAEEAFAVRFARAYLADPDSREMAGLLASGAKIGNGLSPRPGGRVAQAEVSSTEELGGGRLVLTVACELRDARTLYLAVPIARSAAGEVAVLGAPSLVAAPAVAGVEEDRPQPLAGEGAEEIAGIVRRFIPAYLSARSARDLAFLLAPGRTVAPLGGAVRLVGLSGVEQLGAGEGRRRNLIARARVEDPASGAVYPLAYRLRVLRGARWYVAAVAGEPA